MFLGIPIVKFPQVKTLSHTLQEKNGSKLPSTDNSSTVPYYSSTEKDGNGNTRLKPIADLEVHVDYVRVRKDNILPQEFELLINYISRNNTVEIDKPWSPGAGAVYFPHRVIGTHGVVGGFEFTEDGLYNLMIDLPGAYFESKSAVDQWNLIRGLYHCYSVRCTRIDLAIDDYSYQLIPLNEMTVACSKKQNFGFRKHRTILDGDAGENRARTEYFGSRNSGKMVRVYDHDGECHRFEAEYKRGFAQPIFEELAILERNCSGEDWDKEVQKKIASIAVGAIDFRDRGNRKDKSRVGLRDSHRLDFYQQFMDNIKASHCKIRLLKPEKSIRKTLNWVKRQCAPTLSMLFDGFGRHEFNLWMKEVIEIGSERMSNQKNLWSSEIQKNRQIYLRV